jgi:hypothetical protein
MVSWNFLCSLFALMPFAMWGWVGVVSPEDTRATLAAYLHFLLKRPSKLCKKSMEFSTTSKLQTPQSPARRRDSIDITPATSHNPQLQSITNLVAEGQF